jgi:hypothetical protein
LIVLLSWLVKCFYYITPRFGNHNPRKVAKAHSLIDALDGQQPGYEVRYERVYLISCYDVTVYHAHTLVSPQAATLKSNNISNQEA